MHLRLDKLRPTDPGAVKLAQDRQAMERKVMQSMVNEQKHQLDKHLTVKQIVEDEKKIIQDRCREDLERMQHATLSQMRELEQTTIAVKNKNEKLQRVLIEKEASLLESQGQNAKLTSELKSVT